MPKNRGRKNNNNISSSSAINNNNNCSNSDCGNNNNNNVVKVENDDKAKEDPQKTHIKQELDAPPVVHRKSERRRVARDIFLVFEEQPRSRKGRGNQKNAQRHLKPKFAHLMVEPNILLREIKTEPKHDVDSWELQKNKCNISRSSNTKASTTAAAAAATPNETPKTTNDNLKNAPKASIATSTSNNSEVVVPAITPAAKSRSKTPKAAATIKTLKPTDVAREETNALPPSTSSSDALPARVNPIFLWVKQDDTQITEVRCEDYDKRNRIRLTKTNNGWQAIPRTDTSTTRIVKFFQTAKASIPRSPQTCLLKVEKNLYESPFLLRNPIASSTFELPELEKKQNINLINCQRPPQNAQKRNPLRRPKQSTRTNIKSEIGNDKTHTLINHLSLSLNDGNLSLPNDNPPLSQEVADVKDVKPRPRLIRRSKRRQRRRVTRNRIAKKEPARISSSPVHQQNAEIDRSSDIVATAAEPELSQAPLATDTIKEFTSKHNSIDFNSIESFEGNSLLDKDVYKISNLSHATYQITDSPELRLCPKTGLFLPNIEPTDSGILIDIDQCDDDEQSARDSQQSATGESRTVEGLDAKTKNLKDLLEEADLLQSCSVDNTNSGTELIDSLVKHTCESNLIQENQNSQNTGSINLELPGSSIASLPVNDLPQKTKDRIIVVVDDIIPSITDSPKCLSFNEAGEIEGLNGELFQTNSSNFMDTLVRASDSMSTIDLSLQEANALNVPLAQSTPLPNEHLKTPPANATVNTPKDLSYKKREEVCPPSESRGQCAVSSTSDVLAVDAGDDLPTIESASDTIKNIILEQFMKLKNFNSLPLDKQVLDKGIVSNPLGLEKAQPATTVSNDPVPVPVQMSAVTDPVTNQNFFMPEQNGNIIETVLIDDASNEEEPQKKRSRDDSIEENGQKTLTVSLTPNHCMDRDPDPLTQLQLLIRNPQWKVPDPILVPKDRLAAVLASPAREIPLLLTTRPELRLPEAFAYPHIIQNPNILVISMAQLEAILSNEMEIEKAKGQSIEALSDKATLSYEDASVAASKISPPTPADKSTPLPSFHHISPPPPPPQTFPSNDMNTKCSHMDRNSLNSDINAATLAVLNQMLWLPYIGQLSQEFMKSLKDSARTAITNAQGRCNHLVANPATGPVAASNVPTPSPAANAFHHAATNQAAISLQPLEDLYNGYVQQLTHLRHKQQQQQQQASSSLSNAQQSPLIFPTESNAFLNSMETTIFQKLLANQIQSLMNLQQSHNSVSNNNNNNNNNHNMNHKSSQNQSISNPTSMAMALAMATATATAAATKSSEHDIMTNGANPMQPSNGSLMEDSKNIRKHSRDVDNSNSQHNPNETLPMAGCNKTPSSGGKRQFTESKPRLQCKSLSNLLEPETKHLGVAMTSPYIVNLTDDCSKGVSNNHDFHKSQIALDSKLANAQGHLQMSSATLNDTNLLRAAAAAGSLPLASTSSGASLAASNQGHSSSQAFAAEYFSKQHQMQQKRRNSQYLVETNDSSGNANNKNLEFLNNAVDGNSALWHPFFGSNVKSAYSSPWNWTTVTATGK